MSFLVPLNAWLLQPGGDRKIVTVVFFHDLEKWLISTKTHRSELIVIPVFVIYVFDVVYGHTALSLKHLSTLLTNKRSQLQMEMRRKLLLWNDAILVIWVFQFFLQKGFEFGVLWDIWGFEKLYVKLLTLLLLWLHLSRLVIRVIVLSPFLCIHLCVIKS